LIEFRPDCRCNDAAQTFQRLSGGNRTAPIHEGGFEFLQGNAGLIDALAIKRDDPAVGLSGFLFADHR
jgi:hypothetical protein